jgi:hypothetical protein
MRWVGLGAARCDPPAAYDQERFCRWPTGVQLPIEILHELRSGSVSYTPQGYERGAGAGSEKGVGEPDYSFAPNPAPQGCLASG